jgi:uncharacterized protein (TIGR01244 family)
MNINQVTKDYAVSDQIVPADLVEIAAAGFTTVICNRPDSENEADLHAQFIEAEAKRLGLGFVINPISNQGLIMENLRLQAKAIADSDGPVFAYCRSGTRSTICWALVQADRMPVDQIIAAAAHAGYQIENMRPQIESFAVES